MEKRFYWLKLNSDFFNEDKIDFLMSQKGGSNYVVLYQMLCLKAINNNGSLATRVAEVLVPYDVEKIVRDCKFFSKDTVMVALQLYKQLGLIFEEKNKVLKISNFENLVGSEVQSAQRVRDFRERQKQKALQCNKNVTLDVTQEKEIEKEIELDIAFNNNINYQDNNNSERDITCQNFSLPQQKFQETFPQKALNQAVEVPKNIQVDKLIKAIKESEFLKSSDNLKFDWCVEHYEKIIAGNYKDFKKSDSTVIHTTKYTAEEMNSLFTPIEDIEI